MAVTSGLEVIQMFYSSFSDRHELPDSLVNMWLKRAIARYSVELDELFYDDTIMEFSTKLNDYTISTLAEFMKQSYLERQYSMANKRIAITGKDLSVNSGGHQMVHTKNELDYTSLQASEMTENQKPPAYT